MTYKIVYQLNDEGFFIGTTEADESPLEPGVFMIPGGCVEVVPPVEAEGKLLKFENGAWLLIDAPEPETPEEPVELTLEQIKVKKNEEINAARLYANRALFTHGGKAFACDELSRSDIEGTNGVVLLFNDFPEGWPGAWKAVDNSYLTIDTVDKWKAFYLSMFRTGSANFMKAQQLKTQLAAAETIEAVQAIVW